MKTLTVTFHHTTNYGAVLQTYALQQTIMSLGHENVVLDTILKMPKKKTPSSIRELYLRYLSWLRRKQTAKLIKEFNLFRQEKLMMTKPYANMEELNNDPPKVDCLITGSDQVWKFTTTPRFLDARLLQFGKDDAIRFSYAASMEELNYSDAQKEKLKDALVSYKGISVRERSAKEYIESFTPYKVERVLDPVFLLSKDKWLSVSQQPRINSPYILCYQVQSNKQIARVARELKRKTGYPIVSICNSSIRWIQSDYSFHDVSIEEFIGFYNEAAYVVSASFHGVAMGLVFEKPVYALVKSVRANRIKEVMQLFELDDYIISESETAAIKSYTEAVFVKLRSIKEAMISKSLAFLKLMLSDERE